jgi:hypothetical protein
MKSRRKGESGAFEVPDHLPLCMQDIDIMRCTYCGEILSGTWGITRALNRPGIDHYLDRHSDLSWEQVPVKPFINCAIQDPFWFDEHTEDVPDVWGVE